MLLNKKKKAKIRKAGVEVARWQIKKKKGRHIEITLNLFWLWNMFIMFDLKKRTQMSLNHLNDLPAGKIFASDAICSKNHNG